MKWTFSLYHFLNWKNANPISLRELIYLLDLCWVKNLPHMHLSRHDSLPKSNRLLAESFLFQALSPVLLHLTTHVYRCWTGQDGLWWLAFGDGSPMFTSRKVSQDWSQMERCLVRTLFTLQVCLSCIFHPFKTHSPSAGFDSMYTKNGTKCSHWMPTRYQALYRIEQSDKIHALLDLILKYASLMNH